MKRHTDLLLACVSVAVPFTSGCSRPERRGLVQYHARNQAIHALIRQREHAGENGDAVAWVDCFTDDAIIMPANAPAVVGKRAIEEWERGFEGFRPQVQMTVDEVVVYGDWAHVLTSVAGSFIRDDKEFPIKGKELAVLRRVNGQWKFHRVCGNKDSGSRLEHSETESGGK